MKKYGLILTVVVGVLFANRASAIPISLRFTETQMPLGTTASQVPLTGPEYLAFGISVSAVYRYHDSRDPFSDGAENQGGNPYGLSLGFGSRLGVIDFLSPVANLQVDWWTITGTFFLDVFDTNNVNIHTFNGVGNGTQLINFTNIDRLEFHDTGGFVQVSNLRFETTTRTPEPATLGLLGAGLLFLGISRRRKRN